MLHLLFLSSSYSSSCSTFSSLVRMGPMSASRNGRRESSKRLPSQAQRLPAYPITKHHHRLKMPHQGSKVLQRPQWRDKEQSGMLIHNMCLSLFIELRSNRKYIGETFARMTREWAQQMDRPSVDRELQEVKGHSADMEVDKEWRGWRKLDLERRLQMYP